MKAEGADPRPDPRTFSYSMLEGKSPEEKRAIFDAMLERAEDEATARRGRPLQPGDISPVKGRIPTITHQVRRAPDGSWEEIPPHEPREDDR